MGELSSEIREVFEKWYIAQFGKRNYDMLRGFDEEDGYPDVTANALWVGFNAGIQCYPLVKG